MPKPLSAGDEVKVKPTQRTARAGIANIAATVKARCGSVITIEIGNPDSPVYGVYLASESELERVEEA